MDVVRLKATMNNGFSHKPHYKSTHVAYPQNVIPDRSSSKVNVKVCVAVLHPHQAVLLYVRTFKHRLLWPQVFNPGQFPNDLWSFHQIGEPIRDMDFFLTKCYANQYGRRVPYLVNKYDFLF